MRVLESKPGGAQTLLIMGKKKHKLRKHSKENEQCVSDSSDEGAATAGRGCPHLSKAVNFGAIKKALKQVDIVGECTTCAGEKSKRSETTTETVPQESDEFCEAPEPTIWLCLQCGNQGCDRNSNEKHSLKHYQTPRSASHSIVVNVNTWSVWCYDCDDELATENSRKLQECLEFVRKQVALPQRQDSAGTTSGKKLPHAETSALPEPIPECQVEKERHNTRPKSASSQVTAGVTLALAKVKGLQNLGNTCFFNAVMQNLSQTFVLESVLGEHARKGVVVSLPGCGHDSERDDSADSDSDREEERDHQLLMAPITLTLGETGALTQSMMTFLRDMSNPSKNNSICPSNLFGQVCRKAPRFKGYQQQDSHELLRHLLDGMKAEEIKRSQTALLKTFHLPENVNPKKVDEETKAKLKEFGKQAKKTFVDDVFGGYFISTVLCEECKTPSQIFEPFLDISLPITEEKTVRPNSIWGCRKQKSEEEVPSSLQAMMTVETGQVKGRPSKHTSKKAKRQAKKKAKKKGKGKTSQQDPEPSLLAAKDVDGEKEGEDDRRESNSSDNSTKANVDSGTQSEEDISDADIEDNLESDVSASRLLNLNINGPPMEEVTEHSEGSQAQTPVENDTTPLENSEVPRQSDKINNCVERTPKEDIENVDPVVESTVEDMKKLNLNGPIVNGLVDVGKSFDSEKAQTAETNSKCVKTGKKSSLVSDAKLRAMSTLAPRFQPVSHECSVLSCLNQFTSAELLTGNNKFRCDVCTRNKYRMQGKQGKKEIVYTNACKQLLLFSPPAVLTLHMKRFQQVGFSLRKVNRHVEFPLTMDIAPYCSALVQGVAVGQTKVLYSLYGVVEHSGRLSGGHYTAYVKVRPNTGRTKQFLQKMDTTHFKLDKLVETLEGLGSGDEGGEEEGGETSNGELAPPPGKWYYISDSRVSEVSNENNVLRCQAYLLFYERMY